MTTAARVKTKRQVYFVMAGAEVDWAAAEMVAPDGCDGWKQPLSQRGAGRALTQVTMAAGGMHHHFVFVVPGDVQVVVAVPYQGRAAAPVRNR